jgi:hypothetical protein
MTVPAGTVFATLCVETAAARSRDDGTPLTAGVGQPLGRPPGALSNGRKQQFFGP